MDNVALFVQVVNGGQDWEYRCCSTMRSKPNDPKEAPAGADSDCRETEWLGGFFFKASVALFLSLHLFRLGAVVRS